MDGNDIAASPSVTVLMSVFNGDAYLEEAIESILSQSYSDFEFLIINDGSTDNTDTILKHAAKRDARIQVIHQDNQGLVASLNHGLRKARGQLVARIDADDIAYPQRLEKQVSHMAKHPYLLALGSAITLIDSDGNSLKDIYYPVGVDEVRSQMLRGSKLAHPAVIMRRKEVMQVGAYREACRHAEDYDLWLRLLELGDIDNLTEPLLFYRHHENKISVTESFTQRLATECSKFAYQMRLEGKQDPLSRVTLPLRVSSLEEFDLSEKQLGKLYTSIFIRLVKQRHQYSKIEVESIDYIAKWLLRKPKWIIRFSMMKAFFRYFKKCFPFRTL